MAPTTTSPAPPEKPAGPPTLGFLTVIQEASGYLGGYLVTNLWGRPLEFRLTSAVQPNKVQQILYGDALLPYICADLLGKTLVDKAGLPVHLIFTDREAVLDLRLKLEVPVVFVAPLEDPRAPQPTAEVIVSPATAAWSGAVPCRLPTDAAAVRELVSRVESAVDLAEPFARIREAAAEARKMGVTHGVVLGPGASELRERQRPWRTSRTTPRVADAPGSSAPFAPNGSHSFHRFIAPARIRPVSPLTARDTPPSAFWSACMK